MEAWKKTWEWLFDREDTSIKIASHRGKFSSSVIENTSLAFLTAMGEGADIVEMDLDMTGDKVLVGHHDKTMKRLFGLDQKISDYTWDQIRNMPLYNYVGEINGAGLETFDHILDSLKDKTVLALDKCWDYWDQVYEALVRRNMVGQCIFKFPVKNVQAAEWAGCHGDCLFTPMVREAEYLEDVDSLLGKAKVAVVEVVPRKPDADVFEDWVFSWLKERGLKIWCNSLNLGTYHIFGAGYDDLRSLEGGGDKGWGVLVKKGVDIIQTDWPMEASAYLKAIHRKA